MDIIGTISALFSGERVSHTDTFILAAVALGLYIGLRMLRQRMKKTIDPGAFNEIIGP